MRKYYIETVDFMCGFFSNWSEAVLAAQSLSLGRDSVKWITI